jgi:hypothetical protein
MSEPMKIPVYVHAQYDDWEKVYRFHAWGSDMSSQPSCGALVHTGEIDFTPPPHEVLVKGTIEMYRAEQKRIAAEAEAARALYEQKINDLLCLEYKPETT